MASNGVHASLSRPHLALVAFPFGTHAAPLFTLASAIAAAAPDVLLSFISTAQSLASLPSSKELLGNLRLVPIPDGMTKGPEAQPAMREPEKIAMFLATMPGGLQAGLDAAVAAAGGAAVSCVVSDAFLWMAGEVAEAAGAPWVALSTGGTASLSAHIHTDLLRGNFGVDEQAIPRQDELIHFIPALSAYRVRDLPEGVVIGDIDTPFSCCLHRMGQSLRKAAAVLLHTFHGLDPVIDAELEANFTNPLPIGPLHLLSPPVVPAPDTNCCLPWLDHHAAATVVYVSFGSVMTPPPPELAELAQGLEASGAAFLWSLKDKARELLSPGFLDRTKERGLVVSWAPQLDVLRHAAVGAFVTHCGWNSVLEAMTGTVPMVCRPFFGDQRLNERSVSLIWKIGVGFEGGTITKEGMVKALEVVLKSEEGKRMRAKAGELKAMAVRAVEPEGNSRINFKKLLELIGNMPRHDVAH
ncbi:anthocyanidin 3-O-glucosyltransferase 7-like [Canna indica]|uniref:Glycosyltransferase n=1 Tax=Canna indica TaxID=4628 RepID=A0AAQ3KH85_9LILI|nr:anthocyanidin 3-O-glucosyltransferase 7-like [Canna indica]